MPKRLKLRRQDRGAYGGHGVYMGGSRDRRRARSSPHTVSARKHESEESKRKRKKHSEAKDPKTQKLAKSFRRDVEAARQGRDPMRRKLSVARPGPRPVERRVERDPALEERLGRATRADYERQRADMAAARGRYASGSGAADLEQETDAERLRRMKEYSIDMGPTKADIAKHDKAEEEFKAAEAEQAEQGAKWAAKGGRELGYVVHDKPRRAPVKKPVKLGGGAAPPRYIGDLKSEVPEQKQQAPAPAPAAPRQKRQPRNIGAMKSVVPSEAEAYARRLGEARAIATAARKEIEKRRAAKKALEGGQGTMRMGAAPPMPPAVRAAFEKRQAEKKQHKDMEERMQKDLRERNESLKRSSDDVGEESKKLDLMRELHEFDERAQAKIDKHMHERALVEGGRDAFNEMRVRATLLDEADKKIDRDLEAIARGREEAIARGRAEAIRRRDAFNKAQNDILRDMQRVGDVEQVINVPRAPGPKPAPKPEVAPVDPVQEQKEQREEKEEEKASEPPVQRQPAEDMRGLVTNLKIHGKLRGLKNPLDIRGAKRQKPAIVPLPRNVPLPAATGEFKPVVRVNRPKPRREEPVDEEKDDPASRIRPPLGDLEKIDRDLNDLANRLDDKPVDDKNNPVDDNTYNYPWYEPLGPVGDEKQDPDLFLKLKLKKPAREEEKEGREQKEPEPPGPKPNPREDPLWLKLRLGQDAAKRKAETEPVLEFADATGGH